MNNTLVRPNGLIGIDTKTIYDRMCSAEIGELITYHEMNVLIGRNTQGNARSILEAARRKAITSGIVFGVVQNVGVKRLSDDEVGLTSMNVIGRTRRMSKREIRRLAAADPAKMSQASRSLCDLGLSYHGIVAHLGADKQLKRIESAVSKTGSALPTAKMLEALKDS